MMVNVRILLWKPGSRARPHGSTVAGAPEGPARPLPGSHSTAIPGEPELPNQLAGKNTLAQGAEPGNKTQARNPRNIPFQDYVSSEVPVECMLASLDRILPNRDGHYDRAAGSYLHKNTS